VITITILEDVTLVHSPYDEDWIRIMRCYANHKAAKWDAANKCWIIDNYGKYGVHPDDVVAKVRKSYPAYAPSQIVITDRTTPVATTIPAIAPRNYRGLVIDQQSIPQEELTNEKT